MAVTLRAVTKDNYETVAELHIPDEQQQHLSQNIWSIAESKFYETHHIRAIYLNENQASLERLRALIRN